MSEAMIFEALRTPRGKGRTDGSLYEVGPVHLLTGLMTEMQRRHDFDTSEVEDVIVGTVQSYGEQSGVLGRTALLAAGWNHQVPGLQVNRYCGTGLEAVNIAAARVRCGWEDLLAVGGVESMSRMGIGSAPSTRDHQPRLTFQLQPVPQGVSADLMATLDGKTREDVDRFALRSQQLATRARAEARFARSVLPVRDLNGVTLLEQDEHIRPETTLEKLSQLPASFADMGALGFDQMARSKYPQVERIHHVHTPGNSSGIVDGASLALIGSEAKGRALGLTPRARVVSTAVLGAEPTLMLSAPGAVTRKALDKAGLTPEDIDLYEVNEAFASVVLRFMDELRVPLEKVNVNGGAIAMGHPLGASGCMLVGTLLDELERTGGRRGVVTLCAADGMGIATVIERI